MSKQRLLLIFTVLLVFTFVAYLFYSIEWEKVEQEIGLSEKAKTNPLLASTLFLRENDASLIQIDEVSKIFQSEKITLPKEHSLIIDEAVLTEIDLFEKALVEWVKAGGHLIYVLSPRRDMLYLDNNQLLTLSGVNIVEAENSERRLTVIDKPEPNLELKLDKHTLELNIPYNYYFDSCEGKPFNVMQLDLTLICDVAISDGFITLIPSIHPISNSSLKHLDHGEFLLWLIGKNRELFYLPSMQTSSWLELLWNWSWQFITLSLLTLLLYMWNVSTRIGLPSTPILTMKNLFADHIEAVGNFMITHNHHQALKMALLKDLEYVMEKRNPRYKQLQISEQAELISHSTGKNNEEIKYLLTQPLPLDETKRLQFIKLFKELRNSL